MSFEDTVDWLRKSLIPSRDNPTISRCGHVWTHVAGFINVGCIFAIYKNDTQFCVHAGDDWEVNGEPLLGYFDINLSYDDLLVQIAARYDEVRSRRETIQ